MMLRLVLAIFIITALTSTAAAQSITTGAVQGVITDAASGEPVAAVTVIATSPALQGNQAAITDETGQYKITNLPPGRYLISCYYADLVVERTLDVSANKTTPGYVALDMSKAGGEVIVIKSRAPAIDPTSTTQGVTIDNEYTRRLPTGRDYESVLTAAAGGGADDAGATFSGSSSLENQYIVDGVNTTALVSGQLGSPVINDFIEQTEIITGGYNAEFGRSTGGVINVVTKSGSNEFNGSVFGYASPGALVARARPTPTQSASIDGEHRVDYEADGGFELGGPIVRDHVWFYAGLAPQTEHEQLSRVTKRRVDADGNGIADVDPKTGFLVYEELDRERLHTATTTYPFVGKLNFAVTPDHQGSLSIVGTSGKADDFELDGLPTATRFKDHALTTDVASRWTSKLNDGKTELETIVGWHRSSFRQDPLDASAMSMPRQNIFYGDLGVLGGLGGESQRTINGCRDGGPDDPYPMIRNCPDEGVGYAMGGAGYLDNTVEDRRSVRLAATQRIVAGGHHEIKAGIDFEDNQLRTRRGTSGDVIYDVNLPTALTTGETIAARYVLLAPDGNPEGLPDMCPDTDNGTNYACELLGPTSVHAQTVNWAAYLRDSWQIRSDLTINVGLRYEEQHVRYAKDLQNKVDPFTGEYRGTDAVHLKNMWAPRVGVIYDWTGEGRSKVYGSWGRFYESVPMAMNSINFGGETTYRRVYDPAQCGKPVDGIGGPDGPGCEASGQAPALGSNVYGSGALVAPGVKPQYMDETILGVEFAPIDDLKLGLSLHDRRLGRVLEDVSPDNTETYILSNPGEFPAEEEARLRAQIEAATDPAERERLAHQLDLFTSIRTYDKPTRVHNALQLSAVKRFASAFFLQASYTYSRTRGNFPGLYSANSGAILPNISGQYDLVELLGNLYGPLPSDRPHDLKVDGYYVANLKRAGELTTGARFHVASGTPVSGLAASNLYGYDESYVLPRGAFGRSSADMGLDLHLAYGRALSKDVKLEVFTDLFNVFNRQATAVVDESYSYNVVNPILGGNSEDLVYAKTRDLDGNEPVDPMSPTRNRNFRNAKSRTQPFTARLGARLTF